MCFLFSIYDKNVKFEKCHVQNVPAKNVPFSCEREAYPSHFSPFSMCRHRVNAV